MHRSLATQGAVPELVSEWLARFLDKPSPEILGKGVIVGNGKGGRMNRAMLSSERTNWNTPEEFLALVRQLSSDSIAFDPCSNETSMVGADEYISEEIADGLAVSWTERSHGGLIFVNPPYGRQIGKWTSKAREEARRGAEIVLLVPARTDTRWFQRDCFSANAICFWTGRIRFVGAKAGAMFPSAVVYWGPRRQRFGEVFRRKGIIVPFHIM